MRRDHHHKLPLVPATPSQRHTQKPSSRGSWPRCHAPPLPAPDGQPAPGVPSPFLHSPRDGEQHFPDTRQSTAAGPVPAQHFACSSFRYLLLRALHPRSPMDTAPALPADEARLLSQSRITIPRERGGKLYTEVSFLFLFSPPNRAFPPLPSSPGIFPPSPSL